MATKTDIDADLTLELSGKQTSLEFLKAVSAFLNFVEEVTKTSAGDAPRPDWIVQVKGGSNLIQLQPTPGFNPAIIQNTYNLVENGINNIRDESIIPDMYSENALRYLRKLSETDDSEIPMRVWVRKSPLKVSPKIAASIAESLGSEYQDFGTVEGKLQLVSEKGSYRAEITDRLIKKPVKCFLDQELMKEALSIFGQRVEAYGKIRYRADGSIVSIDVEDLTPFPPPEKIPTFDQVRGLYRE